MSHAFYPFGMSYYPVYFQPEDWARDVANMANHGVTLIRAAELLGGWDRLQVREDQYDWSWLDGLFKQCEKQGVRILLGTGSACPPAWIARKYPDVRIISSENQPYPRGAMWNWCCINHPGYRHELERHIQALAARYGTHPMLHGWQINNEPGYPFITTPSGSLPHFDYNPCTLEAFRTWLQEKYAGDLERLNHDWMALPTNIAFDDWAEVEAPRVAPGGWGIHGQWADWCKFRSRNWADFLCWEHHTIRQVDLEHLTMVNTFVLHGNDHFGVHTGLDQWLVAETADCIGYDLYPGIAARHLKQPEYVSHYLSLAYSIAKHHGKDFWLPEMEGGPIDGFYMGPDAATSAEDVVRFAVQGLAHGAKQLSFHPWRECPPMPVHWGAPADLEGQPTRIAEALRDLSRTISQHEDLMVNAQPEAAQVAMIYSRESAIHLHGVEQDRFLLEAYRGAYGALWAAGIPVEFVSPKEIKLGQLEAYKIVFAPLLVAMDAACAQALAAYVEGGGVLVGSAKCPMADERGWWLSRRPGAGLDRVYGVIETGIEVVDELVCIRLSGEARAFADSPSVHGAHHRETIQLEADTQALGYFEDGLPALVRHRYGQGFAYYAATHLDIAYARHAEPGISALYAGMARAAGVTQRYRLEVQDDKHVDLRVLSRAEIDLVILTNPHQKDINVLLHGPTTTLKDLVTAERLEPVQQTLALTVPARLYRMLQTTAPTTAPITA